VPPKKKGLAVVKIQLPARRATHRRLRSATALGPHAWQTMEFCKQYNAATENQRGNRGAGEITILRGRSFLVRAETPPAAILIRQAAGLEKGAVARRSGAGRDHHRRSGDRDRQRTKLPI